MKVIKMRVYANVVTERLMSLAYRRIDEHGSKNFGIRFEGTDPNEQYLTITLYDIDE